MGQILFLIIVGAEITGTITIGTAALVVVNQNFGNLVAVFLSLLFEGPIPPTPK